MILLIEYTNRGDAHCAHRPGWYIGDIIAEVAIKAFLLLLNQFVDNQTRTEFGLEPGGFRGHYVAGVGYVH